MLHGWLVDGALGCWGRFGKSVFGRTGLAGEAVAVVGTHGLNEMVEDVQNTGQLVLGSSRKRRSDNWARVSASWLPVMTLGRREAKSSGLVRSRSQAEARQLRREAARRLDRARLSLLCSAVATRAAKSGSRWMARDGAGCAADELSGTTTTAAKGQQGDDPGTICLVQGEIGGVVFVFHWTWGLGLGALVLGLGALDLGICHGGLDKKRAHRHQVKK